MPGELPDLGVGVCISVEGDIQLFDRNVFYQDGRPTDTVVLLIEDGNTRPDIYRFLGNSQRNCLVYWLLEVLQIPIHRSDLLQTDEPIILKIFKLWDQLLVQTAQFFVSFHSYRYSFQFSVICVYMKNQNGRWLRCRGFEKRQKKEEERVWQRTPNVTINQAWSDVNVKLPEPI